MSTIAAHFVLAAMLFTPAGLIQGPPKPAPAAAADIVKLPDTAAGRALKEFIETFNAGGEKRKAWVEGRTTMPKDVGSKIIQQDAQFLSEYGPMSVVRVAEASPTKIVAIVRHDMTSAHGHLTIDVDAAEPNKVTNMQLRGATPEEIKGL